MTGAAGSRQVTLFLTGDVMTGRGLDQALPHPCEPALDEPLVKSARDYLELAERANGPIAAPLGFADVWGDALAELDRRRPHVRLINLETAVTTSAERAAKTVNYRMNPRNLPVLAAAGVDCCALANNHVLDWGRAGLDETLASLRRAGIAVVGAGPDAAGACAPAILPVPGGRVLVFALGSPTGGVPQDWAASAERSGVCYLARLDEAAVAAMAARVARVRRPADLVVVSLHWGANWGYEIGGEQRAFAHALIERAGVDLVWGHSSHHAKGVELHRGKLILYGCGDFLNDYEGIAGCEAYRGDLALMYFASLRLADGTLQGLTLVPLQIRKFRLNLATRQDARWLCDLLNREGRKLSTRFALGADNELALAGATAAR